ncbi:hypothetical protein BS17DRAFT_703839, partial [Gyrodon lividus]
SPLRPACAPCKHLQLWKPISLIANNPPSTILTILPKSNQSWIKDVIAHTWVKGTKESCGSSLLVFHVFCHAKSIPNCNRAPTNSELVAFFISSLASQYARVTISNYLQVYTAHHAQTQLVT